MVDSSNKSKYSLMVRFVSRLPLMWSMTNGARAADNFRNFACLFEFFCFVPCLGFQFSFIFPYYKTPGIAFALLCVQRANSSSPGWVL